MSKKLGPSPVSKAVSGILGAAGRRVPIKKPPVKDASGVDSYDRMWGRARDGQTTDSNNR